MTLVESVHDAYASKRRVRVLADRLGALLPESGTVLDVGCGDGLLDAILCERQDGLDLRGIDVLVRPDARIPVAEFDGRRIPYEDGAFDVVMFVDVLHHSDHAQELLREAARVARRALVIKDHTLEGLLAGPTLRFMDRVGNERHGVALPYNYWTHERWLEAFEGEQLRVERFERDLGLYPWPASLIFGRSLHFVARLGVPDRALTNP